MCVDITLLAIITLTQEDLFRVPTNVFQMNYAYGAYGALNN